MRLSTVGHRGRLSTLYKDETGIMSNTLQAQPTSFSIIISGVFILFVLHILLKGK